MTTLTPTQIATVAFELDEQQLLELNRLLVERIRVLRAVRESQVKTQIYVGCRVRINGGRKLDNALGTVTRMGRGRVHVSVDGDFRDWRVPATMLTPLAGQALDAENLIAQITGATPS